MTTYYISGEMRGKPDYNREVFNQVESALLGFTGVHDCVINPIKNFDGDVSRPATEQLALDFTQVLASDVIVLIEGWQNSQGANREVQLALWSGKQFMKAIQGLESGDNKLSWRFVPIDAPDFSTSPRADALDEAKQLITGDRNNAYGPPWQDFARSAGALNAYGYRGPDGRNLESHDIAIMIDTVKTSRLMWTPTKRDSWVDKAGYAGCGYECALHDEELRRNREIAEAAARRLKGQDG